MCKNFLWILVFFPLLFSCTQSGTLDLNQFASESSSDSRRRRTSRRNSGSLNESSQPCKDNRSCVDTCDDIYLKATDLNNCYNESEALIKRVADIFDALINPKRLADLRDLDEDDFADFLNIGYQGFLDLVDPVDKDEDGDRRNDDWEDLYAYGAKNARVVLEWLANEEDIAKTLKKEDRNDSIVKELLIAAGKDPLNARSELIILDAFPDPDNPDLNQCKNKIISRHTSDSTEKKVVLDLKREYQNKNECPPSAADGKNTGLSLRKAHLLLGFADNAYDGVSILSYAYGQDAGQNPLTDMLMNSNHFECKNNVSHQDCLNIFFCLALKYEEYRKYYVRQVSQLTAARCESYVY